MLLYERQGDVHFELGGHDDFRNIWFHCVRVRIPFLQSLDFHRSRKADGPPRRWQTRETTRGHLLRHWVLKGMLATTSCHTHTHTEADFKASPSADCEILRKVLLSTRTVV